MLAKLTMVQRKLSTQPVTSVRCSHCGEQLMMTYVDLLWRKVQHQRLWLDVESARARYVKELYLCGLLREYDGKGIEKAVLR